MSEASAVVMLNTTSAPEKAANTVGIDTPSERAAFAFLGQGVVVAHLGHGQLVAHVARAALEQRLHLALEQRRVEVAGNR